MSALAQSSPALPIAHATLRILIVVNWLFGAAIAVLLVAMPTSEWIRSALGVPPSPEADRLIIGLNAMAVVGLIARAASTPAHPLDVDAGFSINGWLATLLTFLLARVFAEGALMRDDLAGTV